MERMAASVLCVSMCGRLHLNVTPRTTWIRPRIVPDDFLDVFIYKEDKTKLRAQIDMKDSKGHPMPYNQLFMLVEASGYQLEHGRKNNRPYIIIREL